ncbi:MAG: hypothetical protein AB8B78_06435 [Polaribacter sp.]
MNILGYIFLFYVGFYFYRLAENHHKNKWLFGFLGIAIYFFGVLIYPLYLKLFNNLEIDEFKITIVSLKSFTTGLLFVFISFQFLGFIWGRKKKIEKKEIEKIGEIES